MDCGSQQTDHSSLLVLLDHLGNACPSLNRGVKRKRQSEDSEAMASKVEALSTAIAADDVASVKIALEEFPTMAMDDICVGPFDYRNNKPRFPMLHFAAREGSVNVLSYLVEERGLNRNQFTKAAGTPLSRAVHSSHFSCVRYLLDAGCDVNRKVPVCQVRECRINLVTPLIIAVSREDPEIVRLILDSGRCNVNTTAGYRETALYFAIKHPTHYELYVEMLLAAGIRPDIKSTTEEPPLLLALKLGRVDVARKLLMHGCDVNARMESPASFGLTALHVASEMDDVDLVRRMLNAGADLEATMNPDSTLGCTPLLHCVAGNRSYKVMSVLIEAGADVTASEKFGRNICHWLVLNGDDQPLKFLLTRCGGTKVDLEAAATDGHDTTPLDYAIVTNNVHATRILLAYNCKLRKVYRQQRESPLEFAIKRGLNELLPCLHQAGSDVTTDIAHGLTVDGGRKAGVHPALRHNAPLRTWLKDVSRKPRSLLDQSRLAIRQSLGTDIVDDVKALEIPRLLQQYVLNIESSVSD